MKANTLDLRSSRIPESSVNLKFRILLFFLPFLKIGDDIDSKSSEQMTGFFKSYLIVVPIKWNSLSLGS